jgi:hypothetical protein
MELRLERSCCLRRNEANQCLLSSKAFLSMDVAMCKNDGKKIARVAALKYDYFE